MNTNFDSWQTKMQSKINLLIENEQHEQANMNRTDGISYAYHTDKKTDRINGARSRSNHIHTREKEKEKEKCTHIAITLAD